MPTVLLVTFALMPDGEPGHRALDAALERRGVDARWVCWDDPTVDWPGADLVAVRSAWDYHRRLTDFLRWARAVGDRAPMLNGPEVFAWNADKAYLLELAEHLPVVPTALLDDDSLTEGLGAAWERWGPVVIKPRTGAGGRGLVVAEPGDLAPLEGLLSAPWVVQPVVDSVRTVGESSVFVIDGQAVAQVDKRAVGGEVRVHEQYGGSSRPVPLDPARVELAEGAVRTAAELRDADLAYARVDLMHHDGQWVLSELEVIEPGLYLDVDPSIAEPFADLVVRRVGGRAG